MVVNLQAVVEKEHV